MNKSTDDPVRNNDLSTITTYQAGIAQASVHRSLQKHCDAILRPYDISKMQWLIIGAVLDTSDAGIRMTDLAKIIDTTLPYLTNTINVLVSKGILQRIENNSDSRSHFIIVNPDFQPKCAQIEMTLRKKLRKSIYSKIDPKDFQTYMKVLYQLSAA